MDLRPVVAAVLAGVAAFGGVLVVTAGDDRAPARAARAAASTPEGLQVFARMGCGGCHTLTAASAHGPIGPNLDTALAGYDRASLRAKITDPYADGPPEEFATMPEDFGGRMSARELDALVGFLLGTRR